jgi:hypothetical protein
MLLTNKFNIPQTFVNVLERPTYSKGKAHLSVTQLIDSPQVVALKSKYQDQIETDVSDMIWSLFGSAIHNILEHGQDDNHITEQRIYADVDGWNISGAIDLQIAKTGGISIKDYKTTSVWSVMNDKIEWEYQLNCYAWLVEKSKGIPVTDLGIVAILRDWKRKEAETKEGYPEAPVKEVPIVLWSMAEREEFIRKRIALHSECDFALETDGILPNCTSEEMWEKPTTWAVMKEGNVRAKNVCSTEEDAVAILAQLKEDKPKDKYLIEVREGERTRCEHFCQVNTWCNQYQTYLKEEV